MPRSPGLVLPSALASAGSVLLAPCFLLAACLSSAGSLPPVRWFDPLPERAAGDESVGVAVRVLAAPHLGREFVVRVGAHEVALDAQHQWIAEPAQLVGSVLARALPASEPPGTVVEAVLEVFELEVAAEPRAHVRVVLGKGRPAQAPAVVDVAVAANDRSPAAFAAAMAGALAQVDARVRAQ